MAGDQQWNQVIRADDAFDQVVCTQQSPVGLAAMNPILLLVVVTGGEAQEALLSI